MEGTKRCTSCGMPLDNPDDVSELDPEKCVHCAPGGDMKDDLEG